MIRDKSTFRIFLSFRCFAYSTTVIRSSRTYSMNALPSYVVMVKFFYHLSFVECNGLTTFLNSSQNGSISLFDHYDNRSCSWLITAPIGQRVLIYFTRFELRNCYKCYCNSVTITDGGQSWSPRLARFCGKDLPAPVYSSGRHIRITFQPEDSGYVSEEFQLQYSTLFHHLSSTFFFY